MNSLRCSTGDVSNQGIPRTSRTTLTMCHPCPWKNRYPSPRETSTRCHPCIWIGPPPWSSAGSLSCKIYAKSIDVQVDDCYRAARMMRARKKHQQLELPTLDKNGQRRGGKRPNAGRKPNGERAGG